MKASIQDFITKIFTQIKNNFGNVDNTSDADKPISKAQQAEFDAINNNLDKHTGNNTIHIIADERTKWDDANDKKHTHSNKSVIDKITQTLLDAWNDAYTHISDTVKHITSDERMSWNNKYSKPSGGIPKTDLASNVQTSLGKADTALQAHQDISGKANVSEAGYSLSVSGTTVSLKNKAGTVLSSITTQDTNTTYSTMTGATSSAAGSTGLVPAPASGKQASFLRGDGTWAVPTDTNTVTTATTTGSGNAVTAITASNGALTVTKGTTFLTSHQDISGKMDKVDPTGTGSFSLNRYPNSTVGNYSFAEGNFTKASGHYSHAEGNNTIASGIASHTEGEMTSAFGDSSHTEGKATSATGDFSHAEGEMTSASGSSSHAEGQSTTASGDSSHAEGSATTASGSYSHAEGSNYTSSGSTQFFDRKVTISDVEYTIKGSTAYSVNSHAEGTQSFAYGYSSHAEGEKTTSSGDASHAEGNGTTSSGFASHAEGNGTKALEDYSHAEGNITTASGTSSHAEGEATIASDWYSHAEGYRTTASGGASHAEGYNTTSSGTSSHAEGFSRNLITETISGYSTSTSNDDILSAWKTKNFSVAHGTYSHVEGENCLALGKDSHAEGNRTIANGESQHVQGKFNVADTTSAFIIGNGEDDSTRSNAMKVDWSGNLEVAGDLKDGSGNTLSEIKNKVNNYNYWLLIGKSVKIYLGNASLNIITTGHTVSASVDSGKLILGRENYVAPTVLFTFKENNNVTYQGSTDNSITITNNGTDNLNVNVISTGECNIVEL